MKIVIAGAGNVGTHLAKLLSGEDHDIVLMDNDRERINSSVNNYEMMTMIGGPTSLKDLNEVGIKNTDVFIGVTPEESVNITACMLAANMGAKKTFARIDNYEYLQSEHKTFFEKLGINSMVYPEMLAAKEIVAAAQRPWVRFWVELCDGAIILVGVKVRENSELVNKKLSEMSNVSKKYHIVAIKRDMHTIIPHGDSVVLADDLLFFTTGKEHVQEIIKITGKTDYTVKDVMIMGGSRIAVRTAQYLPSNVNIKLIEQDRSKCDKLLEVLPKNVTVFHGDGRNVDFLMEEGIKGMDAFVAVTGNSEANILACLAAKRFGVSKTVAEIENMDYVPMAENLDIGTIINKKLITVNNIYRFLLKADVSSFKTLSFANADVAEIVAHPNSKITKKEIKSLSFSKNVTLGGLIRDNQMMLIDGDTQIQADDHVVVFCINDGLAEVEKLFK